MTSLPWSLAEVLSRRPRIRVNQVGYLPGRPMQGSLVSEEIGPVGFRVVRERDAAVMLRGRSQPWPVRPDPTSGQSVHVLDFSGLSGDETYRVEAIGLRSHPFQVASGLYEQLSQDALRFFYVIRSGTPILDSVAPGYGRPAGHAGQLPTRGDDAVPAWTGSDSRQLYRDWHDEGTYDVSGGWYDAGDYGKYVTSGAIAVWQLLGTLDVVSRVGVDPTTDETTDRLGSDLRSECRWQLDWLLRMQVPPGRPFAGLAFHRGPRNGVVTSSGPAAS